jgi:hypothetical protein
VVRRQDEDDATRGADVYYESTTIIAPGGTPLGDPPSKGRCGLLLSFIVDSQYTHHRLC